MKGRKPTADEQRHMDTVASFGCCICAIHFHVYSPAGIHHTQGKTKLGAHFLVLPLCGLHHQTGGYGVALHAGKAEWERRYGAEEELLRWVADRLDELPGPT